MSEEKEIQQDQEPWWCKYKDELEASSKNSEAMREELRKNNYNDFWETLKKYGFRNACEPPNKLL